MPLVFPQFGQPDKAMAQHGFARSSSWTLSDIKDDAEGSTAVLRLSDSEATRALWDHPFSLTYVVSLSAVSLKMSLTVSNTGEAPFKFQALLHTYFRIPDIAKDSISFEISGFWRSPWWGLRGSELPGQGAGHLGRGGEGGDPARLHGSGLRGQGLTLKTPLRRYEMISSKLEALALNYGHLVSIYHIIQYMIYTYNIYNI